MFSDFSPYSSPSKSMCRALCIFKFHFFFVELKYVVVCICLFTHIFVCIVPLFLKNLRVVLQNWHQFSRLMLAHAVTVPFVFSMHHDLQKLVCYVLFNTVSKYPGKKWKIRESSFNFPYTFLDLCFSIFSPQWSASLSLDRQYRQIFYY